MTMLHSAMSGHDVIEFQLANVGDGLRPSLRVAVAKKRKDAAEYRVAGCNHALLRAEDHHIAGRVCVSVKFQTQLVILVLDDIALVKRNGGQRRREILHLRGEGFQPLKLQLHPGPLSPRTTS